MGRSCASKGSYLNSNPDTLAHTEVKNTTRIYLQYNVPRVFVQKRTLSLVSVRLYAWFNVWSHTVMSVSIHGAHFQSVRGKNLSGNSEENSKILQKHLSAWVLAIWPNLVTRNI